MTGAAQHPDAIAPIVRTLLPRACGPPYPAVGFSGRFNTKTTEGVKPVTLCGLRWKSAETNSQASRPREFNIASGSCLPSPQLKTLYSHSGIRTSTGKPIRQRLP